MDGVRQGHFGGGSLRPPPRLFGILARDAPVVAVLRRGPSSWAHIGRWDVAASTYQAGSWLRGTLYPQRCDLSPDGRYLAAMVLVGRAHWAPGTTYVAVSRLPWLTALAAWGTQGTWSRGVHFAAVGEWGLGPPEHGDADPLRSRHGLVVTGTAHTFAVERRGGWVESPGTPPRSPNDMWDERRADQIVMTKPQPYGDAVLSVRGGQAAFRLGPHDRWAGPAYALDGDPLPDVQWADWAHDGRLLVATNEGCLQVRDRAAVVWDLDLAPLEPDPQPPPPEATRW
jgi:hypothetical protein